MMKMGFRAPGSGFLAVCALALGLAAAAPSGAAAQAQVDEECRCVDRDGNRIENCSCFRAPNLRTAFIFGDERPRLGISVDAGQSARRDEAGALVTDVLDDGPAERAGIRRGDVITSIDGQSLFEPLEGDAERSFDLDESVPVQRLLAITRDLEPGQEVEVEFERDGERRTVTVEAEELDDAWGRSFGVVSPGFDAEQMRERAREMAENARAWSFRSRELGDRMRDDEVRLRLERAPRGEVRVFGGGERALAPDVLFERLIGVVGGLELVALNPELGAYFGADEGVLVADVPEDSRLGLQPGDVVLRVGSRAVTTPGQMRRILGSYDAEEEITFHVRRDGAETTVSGFMGR